MSQGERRVKDAVLEMYVASALDEEARAKVEAALEESEADRARLAELRADSAAFLLQHPPAAFAARLEPGKQVPRWSVFAGAALAALALAVFAGVLLMRPVAGPPEYAAKGGPVLEVYRKQGDSAVPVRPGDTLGAGETIQFDVKAGASGYVAVLSRDGAGHVTVYYPYGGDAAAAYTPGQSLLPGAIELDGTPGAESLYALYSPEPFTLSEAVKALESGTPLERALPPAVRVTRGGFTQKP